jgi:hypothetical protein
MKKGVACEEGLMPLFLFLPPSFGKGRGTQGDGLFYLCYH